jgi:D-alanine-D-alanine ligase
LKKLDFSHQLLPLKDNIERFVKELNKYKPDVVVNLCEAFFGDSHKEMHVPSILELLGTPYTGSSPLVLGLCGNKGLAKSILKANEIPTPEYQVLGRPEDWKKEIDFPLLVKPSMEHASTGISRKKSFVKNNEELISQVEYINKCYKQPALVEKYIEGREFNVAILGNEKPTILPISEIVFGFSDEPQIVDYAAKWYTGSDEDLMTTPTCPVKLEPQIKREIERVSLKAYKALCCRDYARVDMRLKGDRPFVLEVNPNPDISHESGFARALKTAGIPFEEFVKKLVLFALKRKEI